ncbi:MAG: beta-N-acetylhexosaminidase, partial [Candidatus Eremiobacteraeota bacterium]|nr:beta-N-acetylhexosaminidase [Candidatus Eremiobacteraeota bacterium]
MEMRPFFSAIFSLAVLASPSLAVAQRIAPALIPQPQSLVAHSCGKSFDFGRPLRVNAAVDEGALSLLNERWHSLGIPRAVRSSAPDITISLHGSSAQSYRLVVDGPRVSIEAGDADGAFYAMMTLAQLPQNVNGAWVLPCVAISDRPALPWRVLSDDISRGPLPSMRYFKERIRTIAAFKMNGYSPYMEHVFADPRNPLPAPLDGITPAELHELSIYAKRFHVAFIPEQQTFAHMHNTLRWEEYAPAAELPHGYLLSPANPLSLRYQKELIADELAAVPHPPFFHIGSDEPSDLGRGQTKTLVDTQGDAAVYAAHITQMADLVAPSGARIMVWDDAIQGKPDILNHIPKSTVIINWHYGAEKTYAPYIKTIASHGFDQMIAPGALNWNEIWPDLAAAIPNEQHFIAQGKDGKVLGLFQTVWHDDGESLYEATWYPVLFAAGSAWETRDVAPDRFAQDFPSAFFGSDDQRYGQDIVALSDAVHRLKAQGDSTHYLFWGDPLDGRIARRVQQS